MAERLGNSPIAIAVFSAGANRLRPAFDQPAAIPLGRRFHNPVWNWVRVDILAALTGDDFYGAQTKTA
jgi:hypothetical protein